ncbi:MAG: ComEA family DNA-binding protein [Alloprevotella sp.]
MSLPSVSFFSFPLRLLLAAVLWCAVSGLWAQMKQETGLKWEDFLSEYGPADEEGLDDRQLEWLESLAQRPLQINRATREELLQLPFLSSAQVDSLLAYRERKRGFLSPGDWMMVSGMDFSTRRFLALFVSCDSAWLSPATPHVSPRRNIWKSGTHALETRFDLPLYRRSGYRTLESPSRSNFYVGDPWAHWLRYRYADGSRCSYGLILQKDAGEPVAKDGFYPYDYLSAHFLLRPEGKRWAFVVSDYELFLNRGLVFGKTLYGGPERLGAALRDDDRFFRPHTSSDENRFFRGAAATFTGRHWTGGVFASYRRADARIEGGEILTFYTNGLHRTLNEIDRRQQADVWAGGGFLRWKGKHLSLTLANSVTHFSQTVNPALQDYNRYVFRGNTAVTSSLGYFLTYGKWTAQGEAALDADLHFATEHLVSFRAGPRLTAYAQARFLTPEFVSLYGEVLTRNTRPRNEGGVIVGCNFSPRNKWQLSGWLDFYRFPQPTYSARQPGAQGLDFQVQSLLSLPKNLTWEMRYKGRVRQRTVTSEKVLEYRQTHRLRCALRRSGKTFSLTGQVDATLATRQTGETNHGWMCSSRAAWNASKRWQLKGFLSYFTATDYEASLYAYEPNWRGGATSTAFFDRGIHGVAMAECKVGNSLFLGARFSSTHYFNRPVQSSGPDEIRSSWKNDLSLQLRYVLKAKK